MRMPLRAYRHDAGWLLGHTFVDFVHVGRRTGRPHEAVAMVLHRDRRSGEVVFCAAWGPDTDWYRNLRAHPAALVRLGRSSFEPEQRILDDDEACDVLEAFAAQHPYRLWLIARVLGQPHLRNLGRSHRAGDSNRDGDCSGDREAVREFVRTHPFVALRPARASSAASPS